MPSEIIEPPLSTPTPDPPDPAKPVVPPPSTPDSDSESSDDAWPRTTLPPMPGNSGSDEFQLALSNSPGPDPLLGEFEVGKPPDLGPKAESSLLGQPPATEGEKTGWFEAPAEDDPTKP